MSQENVETFHKAADAYTRGDLEAYLETAHPDVVWYPFTAEAEGGEAYRGHEGVRRWWSNLESNLGTHRRLIHERWLGPDDAVDHAVGAAYLDADEGDARRRRSARGHCGKREPDRVYGARA